MREKLNNYLEFMLFDSDLEPSGLPDGMVFLEGEKLLLLEEKEKKLKELFTAKGYKKVVPPAFEYYETYEKAGGEQVARRSFSFKDKDGKLLSLRFDMTTPIARMVAHRYKNVKRLKFYYCGNVYREQPFHKGKLRQIRQTGIEFIGENSFAAELEVIEIFRDSLSLLSDNYVIVIGDVRPYKKILEKLNLGETKTKAVEKIFNRKDLTSLEILLRDIDSEEKDKEYLINLINFTGKPEILRKELKDKFPEDICSIMEDFFGLYDRLSILTKDKIIFDFAMIKDFSYYSSLTMEGYIEGKGYAVGSGGRYDELFKRFECDLPAIGFAIQLD
ncbi:MAG: ATP phosphoribosyltransferase regulatory subunit [Brevinematia bacterium]